MPMQISPLKTHKKALLMNRNTLRFHMLVIFFFIMIIQTIITQFTSPEYYMNIFYTVYLVLQGILIIGTTLSYILINDEEVKSKVFMLVALIFYTLSIFYYYDYYPIAITVTLLACIVMEVISLEKITVILYIAITFIGSIFYLSLDFTEFHISLIGDSLSIILPLIVTLYLSIMGIHLLEKNDSTLIGAVIKLSTEHQKLSKLNRSFIEADEEIREQFEKLYDQAYKDGITKLNNKNYLLELLNLLVKDSNSQFSLLMIGFSNYKMEEDFHQYNISSDILEHVSNNLVNLNQDRYEIGYYTGETFYAMIDHTDDATTFSNNIVDLYAESVNIKSLNLDLSIHVGIYDFVYGTSAMDTIHYAEIAMYDARKDKPTGYTTFSMNLLKTP